MERRTHADPGRLGIALLGRDWKLTYYQGARGPEHHLGKATGRGGLDGQNFFTPDAPGVQLLQEILNARPALGQAQPPPLPPEDLEMLRSLGYVQ